MSFNISFIYVVILKSYNFIFIRIKTNLFRSLAHARRKYPAMLKIAEVNWT